jgi:elongation factor G
MDRFDSEQIRNVALIGHTGVGKTTLVEAILTHTGAIRRAGRVEEGTTVCDHEPEEIAHHMTMGLSLAPSVVEGSVVGTVKLNLVDTPGYADYTAEVAAALAVVDLAVVVVSAVEGIQIRTEIAWDMAAQADLPRIILITQLDRERADFDGVLAELRATFGAGVAPLELPIGSQSEFRGVIDLLSDTAVTYPADGSTTTGTTGPLPADLVATEHAIHETLVEGIVVGDDDLMERYLDGDTLSFEELEASLAGGVASATVFPVICASSTTGVGIDRLATILAELCPSPAVRPPALVSAGDIESDVACDPDGPPLVRVFKTMTDPYVGRLSLCRLLSGTVRPDVVLTNVRSHSDERLHTIETLRGKEAVPVPEVVAGDLFAVPKLSEAATGDTLAPRNMPVSVLSPRFPDPDPPALSIAIHPRTKADEDKMMSSLHRLLQEDPALSVRRDDETHQTILEGAGETHVAVALERLARKFGVAVERDDLLVPYRQTITRTVEAEGRYKKQTGGHGQFGVVSLRMTPLPRGEGFSFANEVVGGAIPRQYIPAVEKGVLEAMDQGGTLGCPVVDVAITCLDGKHHAVDSSEMSFKMAGILGFREALAKAAPVLLEPISRVEVTVPADLQGDVLGDLNARRGRVLGSDVDPRGNQIVVALVPVAELARYAVDLRSLTSGRGRFRRRHDHYDVVPSHLTASIAPSASGAGAARVHVA